MQKCRIAATSVLVLFASGCTVAWDMVRTLVVEHAHYPTYGQYVDLKVRGCKYAEEEWKKVAAEGAYSKDYHCGFIQGFSDYLQFGGSGEPPPIPPRPYWKDDSPAGRQAAQDWFAGFRHGADLGKKSGYRELIVVPVSGPDVLPRPNQTDTSYEKPDGAPSIPELPAPRPLPVSP